MSVQRKLYRAWLQCAEGFAAALEGCRPCVAGLVAAGRLMGLSAFTLGRELFLYYEVTGEDVAPEELLAGVLAHLAPWPGQAAPRRFVPLVDVFHFGAPVSREHWRRKAPVARRLGKIGRLRPEDVPHYIFYHYALQEERAFPGDKYEIIGLNETTLMAYFELPAVEEAPQTPPRLNISVVPEDWQQAGISACFIPWEDRLGTEEERLRLMDEALAVWAPQAGA